MSGEFLEYGDGPYPSQQMMHSRLKATGETALAYDRANKIVEVWADGRCVHKSSNLLDAQRVLRQHMKRDDD